MRCVNFQQPRQPSLQAQLGRRKRIVAYSGTPKTAMYNFSQASRQSDLVYGSTRPGSGENVVHHSGPLPVQKQEDVEQWVAFMKDQGIAKVVNLLGPSEVSQYEQPLPATMAASFDFVNVDVENEGFGGAVSAIAEGVAEGKKVVVHCWAGGGRTGMALAAWLAKHQPGQWSSEAAAEEVMGTAAEVGAKRNVKPEKLEAVLQSL